MPMDRLFDDHIWWFLKSAKWKYQFCWLPKRCAFTRKRLWLTNAYRGCAVNTMYGRSFIVEVNWVSKEQYMLMQLRGTINGSS